MKNNNLLYLLLFILLTAGNAKAQSYHLNYNGTSSYVGVNYYSQLQTTTGITVEAWVNTSAWKTPIYKGTVVSTGNNTGQNNGWDLRVGDGGKAEFNIAIGGNWVTTTTAAIMQLGQWYHLAAVYKGDSVIVYINGVMQAASPATGNITALATTTKLYFGSSPGFAGRNYAGKIDEVRVWDYARTKLQIDNNLCNEITAPQTGLVAYFKTNEGTGTTTANSAGVGTGGTLYNLPAASWINTNFNCTLSAPDLGVTALVAPFSAINLGATETVKIKITNYSTQTLSNFPVSYTVNAGTPVTATVSASIAPFSDYVYTFAQTANLSAFQTYTFTATVSLGTDLNTSNNSYTTTVDNYSPNSNFSLNFDGVDDKITVANHSSLNPTTALTIEAWINASAWKTSTWEGTIAGKDLDAPSRGYALRCGNNGCLSFILSDNGSWKSIDTRPLMKTNRWYHVAGVFDGTSMYVYINGELMQCVNATAITPSATSLYIGESPLSGRFFAGKIDEVRIWNIARSQTDLKTNMAISLNGNESGLAAYYKLNEGTSSTVANDLTVNANTGTLTNVNVAQAWQSGFSITPVDVAIKSVESPDDLNAFSSVFRIKAKVRNAGHGPVSTIPVKYSINGGAVVSDTLFSSLNATDEYTLAFTHPETYTAATTFTLTVYTDLAGDADHRNDTLIHVYNKPTGALLNQVTAFNNVHHNFAAQGQGHSTDVIFPDTPENYTQILMHISVSCPAGGCDPWDQAGKIYVTKACDEFELGRFVTPYGKACGPWTIDVTDFKSQLSGSVALNSFIQVWGASGWLLLVKFEFIKGTSATPFSKISALWNNDYLVYGDPNIPYTIPTRNISLTAKTKEVHLRTTITGHGQANTNNAAEFMPATHHAFLNGNSQFSHYVWKTNCGSNTCTNQSGTYTASRAGWCPGQEVIPITNSMTALVTAGQNITVGYALQSYTNTLNTGYNGGSHTEPYMRIHAYLIESSDSAKNFSPFLNMAATRFSSPAPIAASYSATEQVKIVIKNKGTTVTNQYKLTLFVDGNFVLSDNLTQILQPGDSLTHTFSQTVNLSNGNQHTLTGIVTTISDGHAADDIVQIGLNGTIGIENQLLSSEISIVPNPNNGVFDLHVNFEKPNAGKLEIEIFSTDGRKIYQAETTISGSSASKRISLDNLAKGVYLVRLQQQSHSIIRKVVIID